MKNQISQNSVFKTFCLFLFITFSCHYLFADSEKTISFESKDGLIITADLYVPHPNGVPFIILCHQAGWSRGEYIQTAPKLNDLGFNCMAVDLRSGAIVRNISNQTYQRAAKSGKPTGYLDALQDMESALKYAKSAFPEAKIILCGSSYSASLAIMIAGNQPELIDGVIAFSPGEYFAENKLIIKDFAKNIKCPLFITSAKNEENAWKEIYDAIASADKQFFLPATEGNHGSRALWSQFSDSRDYWKALSEFLNQYFAKKDTPKAPAADANDIKWTHPRSNEYVKQRRQMVQQIRNVYGLRDENVLRAMENVPRHWFVPSENAGHAYTDSPLPIGYGQTISQPFIVAYMTSQLKLDKNQKVLEIGTGSGYQAAVLTEFTPHVFTIEIVEPLARVTAERLKELGYKTIKTKIGDGYKGWAEHQPFDAIIVTAAPEHIPQELIKQLAYGGRMIVPVGGSFNQELLLITKDAKGRLDQKKLMPVRFVPMVPGDSK